MTYTLFEFVKEQLTELLDELEEESKSAAALKAITEETKAVHLAPVIKTTETVIAKKEQMTKNQKRRLWDRTNNKGERERGWNWVDILRHLSSTGHKEETQEAVGQLAPPPNNWTFIWNKTKFEIPRTRNFKMNATSVKWFVS